MPAVQRPDLPPAGPPLGASAAAPIGVFDSGVGGLSVLSALVRKLPHEDFVYLGDTARLPYGSQPAAMVRGFPGGDVLPLRLPLTPRAAWTTRGQVAA